MKGLWKESARSTSQYQILSCANFFPAFGPHDVLVLDLMLKLSRNCSRLMSSAGKQERLPIANFQSLVTQQLFRPCSAAPFGASAQAAKTEIQSLEETGLGQNRGFRRALLGIRQLCLACEVALLLPCAGNAFVDRN